MHVVRQRLSCPDNLWSEKCAVGLYFRSHLPKQPSDLKQSGTQEKMPFSGTVFKTLSHSADWLQVLAQKTTF